VANQLAGPTILLFSLLGLTLILALILFLRPSLGATKEGKIVTFLTLFVLPVLCVAWGLSAHLEHSKQTSFCLSCHIMEPYGRSLYVDDPNYLAAAHFQNHRVPAGEACYTCHTQYTMYGGFVAKLRGFRHVYKYYLGSPMNPIHLYEPYNNRECLNCHSGARSFQDFPVHMGEMADLKSNRLSCLTVGCHNTVHNTAQLSNVKFWKPSE